MLSRQYFAERHLAE